MHGNSSSRSWYTLCECPANVLASGSHAALHSPGISLCMKRVGGPQSTQACRICFFLLVLSENMKCPTWQRGNGGWGCGFFTMFKFQKQVISLWSRGMETAEVGTVLCGLIMETEVSGDKSIFLSNRESPLPPVFLCVMPRLIRNWKSEVCYCTQIRSEAEKWSGVLWLLSDTSRQSQKYLSK